MNALTITVTRLLSRLESISQVDHRRTRDIILKRICEEKDVQYRKEQQIAAGVEMLDVSKAVEWRLRRSVLQEIIGSLRYPIMTYRYEDVVEAHPKTFEWAFCNPTEAQLPWSNLSDWLRTGSGVYWVSGKAASGKSTFMKLLFDTIRTREHLRVWAGVTPLCVATFFFWNSGTRQQKSQAGFLRAILYQVLSEYPDLVPTILPREWARSYSNAVQEGFELESGTITWPLPHLMDAFRALTHQKSMPLKICLLVDGLDEFDGNHEEIARLFKEVTSSTVVKVCLSSRPLIVFEDLFSNCPKLQLQNLTYRDIEQYVSDKLNSSDAFQKLAKREPLEAPTLVHEIVEKADGVFLWVKLVVQSLLKGIRNRDDISDLWERLHLLPRELDPLYNRLLELIEPIYLPWVSEAFQIVRANRTLGETPFAESSGKRSVKPLSLSAFYLAISKNIDLTMIQDPSKLESKCQDIIMQLTARCAGFLEVPKTRREKLIEPNCLIQYFHRTARDFLEGESTWCKLLMHTSTTNFNPHVAMMRSCVLTLWSISPLNMDLEAVNRCRAIDLANDTMIYAYHADGDSKTHRAQIILLDQFVTLMDSIDTTWNASVDWISETISLSLKWSPAQGNFLEDLAIVFNLVGYVSDKVTPRASLTNGKCSLATTLLCLLLLPTEDYCSIWDLPLPGTEMVSLLLDRGADPNGWDDDVSSLTPWESALSYVMRIEPIKLSPPIPILSSLEEIRVPYMMDDDLPNTKRAVNYDGVRRAACRYIQIMQKLLLAGANPKARVFDHWKHQEMFGALDIVKNNLVEAFPLEAAPLLRDLKQALAPPVSQKGKMISRYETEESGEEEGMR